MNKKPRAMRSPYVGIEEIFRAITPEVIQKTTELVFETNRSSSDQRIAKNSELLVAISAILLKGLAMSDGRVDAKEMKLFGHLLLDLLMDHKLKRQKILTVIANVNRRNIASWKSMLLYSRHAAKVFMRDMIKMAFADSDFSECERQFILNVGKQTGFELHEIGKLVNYVGKVYFAEMELSKYCEQN